MNNLPAVILTILFVFLLLASFVGCGSPQYYGEIGVGHNTSSDGFEGQNPTGILKLGADWGTYRCELEHISFVFDGRPHSTRNEDSIDMFACLRRFDF